MTSIELATHLNQVSTRRQAQIHNRQLAEALAMEAHIQPEGRQLVAFIGRLSDRTNLEALVSWIARELTGLDLAGLDPLDYLYIRLAKRLEH